MNKGDIFSIGFIFGFIFGFIVCTVMIKIIQWG
jgi:hypothetical protein